MNYERGLEQLKRLLSGTAGYQEILVYEARLRENLEAERLYTADQQTRSERMRIVEQLNRLAHEYLDISFNELCAGTFRKLIAQGASDDVQESEEQRSARDVSDASVFISYSHGDRRYLDELTVHLKPLVRRGVVHVWDDTKILPGSRWNEELERALRSANVAVLLISADFLASDFIADRELPYLLEAARSKRLVILCVIVRPCSFTTSELAGFQAVNVPSRPLSVMSQAERERVWTKVADLVSNLSTW